MEGVLISVLELIFSKSAAHKFVFPQMDIDLLNASLTSFLRLVCLLMELRAASQPFLSALVHVDYSSLLVQSYPYCIQSLL
jgi:hypothetical protein